MASWSSIGSAISSIGSAISSETKKTEELKMEKFPDFDQHMKKLKNATPDTFLGMKAEGEVDLTALQPPAEQSRSERQALLEQRLKDTK